MASPVNYERLAQQAVTQVKQHAASLQDGQASYFTTDKTGETHKKSSVLLEKKVDAISATMKSGGTTHTALFKGDTVTAGDAPPDKPASTPVLQAVINHVTAGAETVSAKPPAINKPDSNEPPVGEFPTGVTTDTATTDDTANSSDIPVQDLPTGTGEFTDTNSFRAPRLA
jgi:hypothetical protein